LRDKRVRAIRGLITERGGPKPLEWASPTQEAFFRYGPAPACASGGFGAGKTAAACLKGLYLSDIYPNNRGVIARKTWEDLKKTTLPTLLKFLKPQAYKYGGKFAPSEKLIELNPRRLMDGTEVPGSQILLLHLDDPDTEHVIKGLEINWFLIDQAEDVAEELFDLLVRRLGRWDQTVVPPEIVATETAQGREWPWWDSTHTRPVPPTYPMLTCNPDHLYHWIYRRFHADSPDHYEKRLVNPNDPESTELVSYKDLGYQMFQFPSMSNKFLTKQNRVALLSGDESFQRRYVRGEWGIPEGQIHDVPKEALIAGSPEVLNWIRDTCTLHRILDHGDSAPTCCGWGAVGREGDLFIFREYYMPNKLISEHRRNIAGLSRGERYTFNIADPSIFHPTMQKEGKRWSVQDEYSDVRQHPRETAIHWQKGDKDELGTRNRISEYLRPVGTGKIDPLTGKEEPRIHPITKEKGYWPRLFFITKTASYPQGCDHIVRETRAQKRKKIGTENGKPSFSDDRDDSVPDHGYDVLRYFVASRPPTGPAPVNGAARWNSFEVWRKSDAEFKKRGGFKLLADRLRKYA
jgi:hypothetical protein